MLEISNSNAALQQLASQIAALELLISNIPLDEMQHSKCWKKVWKLKCKISVKIKI